MTSTGPDSALPPSLTARDNAFNLDAWASTSHHSPALVPDHGDPSKAAAPPRSHSSGSPGARDRPAWAALKTKAGKDRKRLPLACIACRRKKVKCSGEKPTCQHCIKARIPCVYKVTQRKAAPRTDYMAMLDKRLKRMEDRVIRIVPKAQAETIPRAVVKPTAPTQASDTSKKRPAGPALRESDLDLDGWAAGGRPRSPAELPRTLFAGKQDLGTAVEGADALPSLEIQEHLAEVYFDYVYGQSYFLLHKPRYMLNLKTGSLPPYLNLAVCAVSARFASHPSLQTEPAFLRGEDWAKAAQVVAMRYFDTPNIVTVIVYILLSLHGFGACQGGRAFMLSGMAHRMSYSLRLHRDPDHDGLGGERGVDLDVVTREMRRRAMWACFQMDRFTASGQEKPLFAREGYLSALPLPVNEMMYVLEMPAPTEMLDGSRAPSTDGVDPESAKNPTQNLGIAAFVVRVIAIWGRILEDMSIGPRAGDDVASSWPSRSSWQSLSASLRSYQSSLPSTYLYTPENLEFHASSGTANGFLLLHLVYNHCLLFLHRFAFPVIAGQLPGRGGTSQVLETARQTALDAADRISDIVSNAQEHRLTFPFGGYVAYVSSAVHLYGAFSRDTKRQQVAKHNLTLNIKYLSRMKKHWGMYHILTENLKDLYRQYAEAAKRGTSVLSDAGGKRGFYQYSELQDRYPQGVSMADYEEVLALKPSAKDAILGESSDLQSVENWVANRPEVSPTESSSATHGPRRKRARAVNRQSIPDDSKFAQSTSRKHSAKQTGKRARAGGDASEDDQSHWTQRSIRSDDLNPDPNPAPGLQELQPSGAPAALLTDPAAAPTFSGAGFSDDPTSELWNSNWSSFENELRMFSEPYNDWNAILNMDMIPGFGDGTTPSSANNINTDAMWLGDIMPDVANSSTGGGDLGPNQPM